jgi:hypothetical protein
VDINPAENSLPVKTELINFRHGSRFLSELMWKINLLIIGNFPFTQRPGSYIRP